MKLLKVKILGVNIDDFSLLEIASIIKRRIKDKVKTLIVTPNPEICLAALENEYYRREILNKADLSIADGFGLKIAARILNQKIKNRITGVDLTYKLMELSEKNYWEVFLLGGEYGEAQLAAEKLKQKYGQLKIVGIDKGLDRDDFKFKHNKYFYNEKKNNLILQKINNSKAKVIVFASGFPRQEFWLKDNLPKLNTVLVGIGAGGTFNYIGNRIKRAPSWIRKIGMEWLYRLITEPSRWSRIFKAVVIFPWQVIRFRLRMAFVYRRNAMAVIMNNKNEILIAQNKILTEKDGSAHWQMPQGGIEGKEFYEDGVIREMCEELGVPGKLLQVIKRLPITHTHTWPLQNKLVLGFKGQSQKVFLLKFLGKEKDFDLSKQDELTKIKWVDLSDLVDSVNYVRKLSAQKVVDYLQKENEKA